ncbi:MAG: AI-2E family transporter [Candidatus Eisenbacteria bacterium]|uniref:AI-2E family transporter n=1 Tax=Eiseniibacteriota bacterium TaxID=2212470 RepID=A0A538S742_UNCEI|nr:MAG: AI-2E family transporter [Candidatus Eisenbacteria bacterium]
MGRDATRSGTTCPRQPHGTQHPGRRAAILWNGASVHARPGGDMAKAANGSARSMLLALLVVALVLVWLVIRPFAAALFMALVMAVTFYPWRNRLAARLDGHRTLASFLITLGLLIALVLPVLTLGVVAIREAADGLDYMHQVLAEEGVEGLIRVVPEPLQAWMARAWEQLPRKDQNAEFIFDLERRGAGLIPRALNWAGQIVGQTALMMIGLFFMLLDGGRLAGWVTETSPLPRKQMRELYTEFRKVSATVLLGSVVTAGVEAAFAFVGYLIARAPNASFLALATFFLGLIPILGAGGFSFLVAVFLYMTGHLGSAVFLAAWSLLVVGTVDNVIKPMIIKGGMELHGAIVFFALLGGLAAFGPVGLVLGPLSVSLLLAVLRIYQRDFAADDAAAVAAAPGAGASESGGPPPSA